MGVPCPGCGRQYDVTLFQFGRTIDCTCGVRVADRARIRPDVESGHFIADAMLGRLARWLRIAGFDVTYEAHIPDEILVRRALQEDRIVLTRDRRLPREWSVPRLQVVAAEQVLEQLAEVLAEHDLRDRVRVFSRCSLCNAPLVQATDDVIEARVPTRVREITDEFRRCPICDRVYWRGTHTERMQATLDAVCSSLEAAAPLTPETQMPSDQVTLNRWDDMPKERLNELIERRLVTGERIMLAHVYLKKGAVVPMHEHDNEQMTYILGGAIRFWIGSEDAEPIDVREGEVLHIPSNVPHKAEALEDTFDVDVFSPPRQDWLDGSDSYLRGK